MTEIRTASDLLRLERTTALLPAPLEFDGTLEELYEGWIEPNLPSPAAVAGFHRVFAAYVAQPDALHLVRKTGRMVRREVYATRGGTRLRATDNSPAWWIQHALHLGARIPADAIGEVIETMPTHMFDVSRVQRTSAAAAGWHIAHLFEVKDRQTAYEEWSRDAVGGYFTRNIHPCNHFLLPKPEWQRWGGDACVLAFFGERYATRYADVWGEFLQLARVDVGRLGRVEGPIPYSYASGERRSTGRTARSSSPVPIPGPPGHKPAGDRAEVNEYQASRLTFKRDVIEALGPGEAFRCVTPAGCFQMTRAEFYEAFPTVPLTKSYREVGIYHFPKVPRAAGRFLVAEQASSE